jgi:3-methyl-2-oxobutanoate hydroxymethyltransferase
MLTAYDAVTARLADEVADIVLVGDSVGTTVQGGANTIAVTMDEMVYHTRLVARNTTRAMVVADMPFMSYQSDRRDALLNAARFLKESSAQAVKVEGASEAVIECIRAMVDAGIPVMGHIGFTPQSELVSGIRVKRDHEVLQEEIARLADAGVFSVVLEMVQADIAAKLTASSRIPTIGIGAGAECSGQVLVIHDVLGFNPDFRPKFVRRYMDFFGQAQRALGQFSSDVRSGAFPAPEHHFEAGKKH